MGVPGSLREVISAVIGLGARQPDKLRQVLRSRLPKLKSSGAKSLLDLAMAVLQSSTDTSPYPPRAFPRSFFCDLYALGGRMVVAIADPVLGSRVSWRKTHSVRWSFCPSGKEATPENQMGKHVEKLFIMPFQQPIFRGVES